MTYLAELFSQVFGSLLRNKLRSFLTMAGIAWGIASVVIIVAMGDGFKEGQKRSMKSLGENIVILFGGRTEKQAGGQRAGRRIRLTYSDVEAIRSECWMVDYAVGEIESTNRGTSSFNSGAFDTDGVEPDFGKLRTVPVVEGRWFTDEDNREARSVAIIGPKVKKQLFAGRTDVLGQQIAINSLPFQVIGILADKNQDSSYGSLDESKIFIPYQTAVRDIPPKEAYYFAGLLDDIIYKPHSLEQFEAARKQVIGLLGRRHQFDPTDDSALGIWDTVENAKGNRCALPIDDRLPHDHRVGHVKPRRRRSDEHHAGHSQRTHARSRIAQSSRRHAVSHHDGFPCGRRSARVRERRDRLDGCLRFIERTRASEDARCVSRVTRQRADHGDDVRRSGRDCDCVGSVSRLARGFADSC